MSTPKVGESARSDIWRGPTPTEEVWLARKLGRTDIVLGATTAASRHEGFRRVIRDRGLANVECGRKGGVPETYGALYARWYGEPVQ
jgi:hypothetical protein